MDSMRPFQLSLAVAACVALVGTGVVVVRAGDESAPRRAAPVAAVSPSLLPSTPPSSTAPRRSAAPSPSPTPTRTVAPPSPTPRPAPRPTTVAPSPTPKRVTPPAPRPTPRPAGLSMYRGLGTWVDAYDFSSELGGARLRPSEVDAMYARGVRTLYIQAAKEHAKSPGLMLSPGLLGEWLERAHQRGMSVVAWYLPTFVDPARDWAHLDAIIRFRSHGHRFDSIGMDIESREVGDDDVRSARLVALSRRLRAAVPSMTLQAIVVPPVVTDVINPKFWPRFPWKELAPAYDVWSPMGYWTNRTPESGWRSAYRYTVENVRLLRKNIGQPNAPVHIVGGIGNETTDADLDGFVRAAREQRCIGGSLYDYATTAASAYVRLRQVPR
jgi:hypothetical protein